MTEDTSRGDHDTLMAACDSERYILLGVKEYHDNCTDNLFAAMQGLGLTPPECPSPLNLFMNIPWTPNGKLSFDPPTTKPGDYVTLRAELDCIVAMSACPQDLLPINGEAGKPTEAHFEVDRRRSYAGGARERPVARRLMSHDAPAGVARPQLKRSSPAPAGCIRGTSPGSRSSGSGRLPS